MSKTTKIRQQTFTAPPAAANTGIHAAMTLPTSGVSEVTTAITNPAVPRTIRLKGNQATVQGLVIGIEGTDIQGNVITENVTMGGDYTVPTDSLKAFATVTKFTLPTRGGASDTVSAGPGAALGLDCYCDAHSFTGFSGTSARTVHATDIALNTATLSATMNGSDSHALNYVPATFPVYNRIYG